MIQKKYLATLAAIAVVGGSALTITQVQAMGGFGNGDSTFIQQLASKLGKSEDEVQTAMDQIRDDHQADMQAQYEQSLSEAVSNGEITEEQKQLVLNKHAEMQSQREAQQGAMQFQRDELETWAQENGIDTKYLFGGGPGDGRGPRDDMGRGMRMGK